MLGVVDASYKFLYVDAGAAGRDGDAGVFNESTLNEALKKKSLNLPAATNITEDGGMMMHYHMVADDAFALTHNMMKPYPHRHLDKQKRIFNYRLSRARRVVENAFGILAHRFRVFLTRNKLEPKKVTDLILAACCLHKYLVCVNTHIYTSAGDVENADHSISPGRWRQDYQLPSVERTCHNRNPARSAKEQREFLASYFCNAGAVPWQDNIIA